MAPSFAAKLAQLFDECRAPDGRRYTNQEVVEHINAGGQAKISRSYLSELLNGKKDNPNIYTVKALADFFGQPMDYFVEPNLRPRQRSGSLSARLNLLFALAGQPGTTPPTTGDVAQALRQRGFDISDDQVEAIRSGEPTELPANLIAALASVFNVPSIVLTDDQAIDQWVAKLPDLQLLQNDSVRKIALRAHELSDRDRRIVTSLLERLAREDPGMTPDDLTF